MDGMLCWLVVQLKLASDSAQFWYRKRTFHCCSKTLHFSTEPFCACRTALVCPDDGLELRCVSKFAEDHSFKPTAVMPADIFSYVGGVFWLVCVCVCVCR